MTDIAPGLINTDVIKNTWDAYWHVSEEFTKQNSKRVLIFTQTLDPGSPEEIQLLKMLQACNLGNDIYTILHLKENQPVAWQSLKQYCNPKVVLLMGILPKQLGIVALLSFNSINNFDDIFWIPTASVAELEKQRDIKLQLWADALKPIFIDKKFGDLK